MSLPAWEGATLVHAAGLIAVLRGLALALAGSTALFACLPPTTHQAVVTLAGLLIASAFLAAGDGVLRRWAFCRPYLAITSVGWVTVLLMLAPVVLHLGGPFDLLSLRAEPLLVVLLPAFFLPDVYLIHAMYGRNSGKAFLPTPGLLPSIVTASRTRSTGRILTAQGMVALAFLSSAALAFLGPGVLLACR